MRKRDRITLVLALLLFLWGCSDGDGTGTLKVSLTDAPACGFDEVNVTISKIRIHQSAGADENSSGWIEWDLIPARKINLTSLTNGILEELGTTPLSKGRYTQLRLVLASNAGSAPPSNSVVLSGETGEIPLETPSAAQSGVKLIHSFGVREDELIDLVLDFDACRSVVPKGDGKYLLKPVISVIPLAVSGRITGVVGPQLSDGASMSNPTVTAQRGGRVVKSTIPDSNGSFVLSPLLESGTAGTYDVVLTADNGASVVIQSVPVTAGAAAAVSSVDDPVILVSSSSHTVRGVVLPAASTVRATQTFSTALATATIEVRSTNVNLSDGSYSLLLPAGAPSIGFFGTGNLPIILATDTPVAGKYTLEASSEGFPTKEGPVTLNRDLTHDFNLTH